MDKTMCAHCGREIKAVDRYIVKYKCGTSFGRDDVCIRGKWCKRLEAAYNRGVADAVKDLCAMRTKAQGGSND